MLSLTEAALERFDNQHDFERMCADILNAKGYQDVVLVSPRGGSDEGKDITFRFEDHKRGLACVTLRKDLEAKFREDFHRRRPDEYDTYYLFCNVNVTASQKRKYSQYCRDHLDAELVIQDIEALRSLLDGSLKEIRRMYLSAALRDLLSPQPMPGLTRNMSVSERILRYTEGMMAWQRLWRIDRYQMPIFAACDSLSVPLNQLVREHPRLTITGSPGCGKTVFMLQLLHSSCRTLTESLMRGTQSAVSLAVPVFVEISLLSPSDSTTSPGILWERILAARLLGQLGIMPQENPMPNLVTLLKECRLLLLLDGLNELPDDHRVGFAKGLIALDQDLAAQGHYNRIQIVITSRSYGFIDHLSPYGYKRAEVLPLTPQAIESELSRRIPQELFRQIDAKTRQLLSNPQHLDYAIQWCRDQLEGGNRLKGTLRTKGELLEYICTKSLESIPSPERRQVQHALCWLGYQLEDSSMVQHTIPDVLKIFNEASQRFGSTISTELLLEDAFYVGLLVEARGCCRFAHHSIQQYFAARQMERLWRLDKYVSSQMWHETLAIMAGILDRDRLPELLKSVESDTRLFACVLANVYEPDIEREFIVKITDDFVTQTHHWAIWLSRVLKLLAALWSLLLPLPVCLSVASPYPGTRMVAALLGIGYLVALPPILVHWYRRQFHYRMERLRNRELPYLISILRTLLARSAMQRVQKDLNAIRSKMKYDAADPRTAFVDEAIATIDQVIGIPSYMTIDEMLEHLSDPLMAATVEPEHLSASQVEVLCSKARDPVDEVASLQAMVLLRRLCDKDHECRRQIVDVLQAVALGRGYSRRQRRKAAQICRELGVALPTTGCNLAVNSILLRISAISRRKRRSVE